MNDNKNWFLQNEDGKYLALNLTYTERQEFAIRFNKRQSAYDFYRNNLPDDELIAIHEEIKQ